jgi:predicted thioesterase
MAMDVPSIREFVVRPEDTAAAYGAAFPAAASTPFVLGLAEVACHALIAPTLEGVETSLGVHALVDHLVPSPVGARLRVVPRLDRQEGRRYFFHVDVFDRDDLAASIDHVRVVTLRANVERRLASRAPAEP